jgi:hypothetical protein
MGEFSESDNLLDDAIIGEVTNTFEQALWTDSGILLSMEVSDSAHLKETRKSDATGLFV